MKNAKNLILTDYIASKQPVVFFDGDCSLCSSSVRFLIRNNHSGNLNFASLQSDTGLKILKLTGMMPQQTDTLLLLRDNTVLSYSTAAIEITKHLGFPLNLLRILIFIPVSFRDAFYRFIARNRYRWFGKKSFCMMDVNGYRNRILN